MLCQVSECPLGRVVVAEKRLECVDGFVLGQLLDSYHSKMLTGLVPHSGAWVILVHFSQTLQAGRCGNLG